MSTTDESGDDLRARLRAADPARSLEPLDDDRITRMVNLTTSSPTPSGSPRRAPRRRLLFGLAGATGLTAAVLAAVSVLSPTATSATRLVMPVDGGGAAGSCVGVLAEYLDDFPMAFEGRATSVSEDEATLEVTDVFRGEPGSTVVIELPELSDGDYSGFAIDAGGDYLIAVLDSGLPQADSQIALCGFSGPASPDLRAVYEEAFR